MTITSTDTPLSSSSPSHDINHNDNNHIVNDNNEKQDDNYIINGTKTLNGDSDHIKVTIEDVNVADKINNVNGHVTPDNDDDDNDIDKAPIRIPNQLDYCESHWTRW